MSATLIPSSPQTQITQLEEILNQSMINTREAMALVRTLQTENESLRKLLKDAIEIAERVVKRV